MTASSGQQLAAPSPPGAGRNGHRTTGGGWGGGLPTRRVAKGYVALAVALIVGFCALGVWFYSRAGAKVSVVQARVDIPAGHPITRADLTTVPVAGPLVAVAAGHLDTLVGQTAAVEILPDTLVQRAMVTAAPAVPADDALVGVSVGPGHLPSAGLAPGDHVQVLQLPAKGSALPAKGKATSAAVLAASVRVFDVRADPSAAGGTLLTLVVAKGDAFGIAAASAAGQVALVQVGS